jgi:hypothetical protein
MRAAIRLKSKFIDAYGIVPRLNLRLEELDGFVCGCLWSKRGGRGGSRGRLGARA